MNIGTGLAVGRHIGGADPLERVLCITEESFVSAGDGLARALAEADRSGLLDEQDLGEESMDAPRVGVVSQGSGVAPAGADAARAGSCGERSVLKRDGAKMRGGKTIFRIGRES